MISEQLEIIIQKAFELAKNKKHEFLTLEHLLMELCDADDVKKFFSYKMINIQSIKNDLNGYIEKKLKTIVVKEDVKPVPSLSFERVLKRAAQHVQSSRKGEVQTLNILVAMFSERDSFAVYFLEKQNLTRLDLVSYISHEKDKDEYNNETKENISEESNQEAKSQHSLLEKD